MNSHDNNEIREIDNTEIDEIEVDEPVNATRKVKPLAKGQQTLISLLQILRLKV